MTSSRSRRENTLEHPDLEPFEPFLRACFDEVFEGGIAALQKHGDLRDPKDLLSVIDRNPSAFRRFIRGCHYSWDIAQRTIAETVVAYEAKARNLEQQHKEASRGRNKEELANTRAVISTLRWRQLVLRRMADAILYHLLKFHNWILRRIMLEYRIREVDPVTLAQTVAKATELNRKERMDFHLVSDLTTVVHVGDLVRVRFTCRPPAWDLIELKEGKLNAVLGDVLDKAGGELQEEHIMRIREEFGDKAVQQAKRMERQRTREKQFLEIVTKDEGVDIMHQVPTKLHPGVVEVQDYRDAMGTACEKAWETGVGVAVVDDCLRLIAATRDALRRIGHRGISHLLYHLQFGLAECGLTRGESDELGKLDSIYPFFDLVQMNLTAMWPPPVFTWPFPKDFLFHLLFQRVTVFAQLDYDRLFEKARDYGVHIRWATDKDFRDYKRLSRVIPGSPNSRGGVASLIDRPDLQPQTLMIGFFSRMFLEFMSPRQFLELVKAGFFSATFARTAHPKTPNP